MKVVVNDANILIDLSKLDLVNAFFQLSWEMHTTDMIYIPISFLCIPDKTLVDVKLSYKNQDKTNVTYNEIKSNNDNIEILEFIIEIIKCCNDFSGQRERLSLENYLK